MEGITRLRVSRKQMYASKTVVVYMLLLPGFSFPFPFIYPTEIKKGKSKMVKRENAKYWY